MQNPRAQSAALCVRLADASDAGHHAATSNGLNSLGQQCCNLDHRGNMVELTLCICFQSIIDCCKTRGLSSAIYSGAMAATAGRCNCLLGCQRNVRCSKDQKTCSTTAGMDVFFHQIKLLNLTGDRLISTPLLQGRPPSRWEQ